MLINGTRNYDDESFFLTGASGFLGSHIMAALLLKGKSVVIAGRPSNSKSLRHRISWLLEWFGIEHLKAKLEFYETDFLKPRLGLSETAYNDLCGRKLVIIHCASDTSFAEKNRERVMRSNVESLHEILNFAIKSKSRFFHYIGTAYAAGTDHIECPEAAVRSVHFNNVYEESKARAESIVSATCLKGNIPFTIIRPSIVYGDSVTGRSLRFNALYYPVRSMQYIRDIYLNDIKNNGGRKSAEYGIYINDEGVLYLPIRVFLPSEGRINLIPVDYFTKAVLSIIKNPGANTFYHIAGNNPESLEILASYTERFLNINGIEVVIGKAGADDMRNPAEELFDHFIRSYLPYISDKRIFRRENTNQVVSTLPPDLSYEIFEKCMAFAVSADWGKNF